MAEASRAQLLSMLKEMIRIRIFEETVEEQSMKGHVQGGIHLAIGQEAVAVGASHALNPADYVTGSHRGHHVCLARGVRPDAMMAELMGKVTGLSRGKSSSMHLIDKSRAVLGLNGIVGAAIGIATGAAFSLKYQKSGLVAVAFFGEGAANKGQFHESMNLAALWGLPVIYICENNMYSVETHITQSTAGGGVAHRANSYGFPGVTVDGMDVMAVYKAVQEARQRAMEGSPTLIEAKTYRFKGHELGDPQNYRAQEEVNQWKVNDPIVRLEKMLVEANGINSEGLARLHQEMAEEVNQAVRFALESPVPDRSSAYQYIYANEEA